MTRLIDADKLHTLFDEKCQRKCTSCPYWTNCNGHMYCELIDNAPTVEFPFVHVIIKHPRFGECDGWLDKQRNLLFFDFITTEAASKWNWSWKEAKNNDEKVD